MASTTPSSSKPGPMMWPSEVSAASLPPKQKLVVFAALAVHAQDADVARMVVAAGVDAARNLQLQLAQVSSLPLAAKRSLIFCATGSSAHWPASNPARGRR
jgi:hypothetical protein